MKFLDEAKIFLQSGKGGNGCVSFRREKYVEFGGPDGGDGGNGGNIVFKGSNNRNTLIDFRFQQHFKAQKGKDGAGKKRKGANGNTIYIEVPIGTSVYSDDYTVKLLEIFDENTEVVFLKGGKGGFGNHKFKSSKNVAPKKANLGYPGEEMWVRLRLNLIADIGIVGLPNVGKSSFLKFVTNANPKVGNYPFTTLFPNLGVINNKDYQEIILADIPGIIENAFNGSGLGLKFLGHIEKCSQILHFVDINKKNIIKDYQVIRNELNKYGKGLDKKKEILVLTKKDLVNDTVFKKKINNLKSYTGKNIYAISIKDKKSVDSLINKLVKKNKDILTEKEIKWTP
ncbi:MAG: GTPase Obg/CgtA [Alphaproteobacteria bacterium MarineAlpha9_Bin4]|nr:MAG: GTPase Obg/CgtA [Alphaproteobacteria bacterium MarineAlpha9_Bin4]